MCANAGDPAASCRHGRQWDLKRDRFLVAVGRTMLEYRVAKRRRLRNQESEHGESEHPFPEFGPKVPRCAADPATARARMSGFDSSFCHGDAAAFTLDSFCLALMHGEFAGRAL